MKIAIIGTGYVGLVTGACFAELGNHVVCIDVDKTKIVNLKQGKVPLYEPGLEALVLSNMAAGRLSFVSSLDEIATEDHPHVFFIAVGTPSDQNGSADVEAVYLAARQIGAYLSSDCVVVNKSTVPVGVTDKITSIVFDQLVKRDIHVKVDVVSNPEFLREGAAIDDFMEPDRIVLGLSSVMARDVMVALYAPIARQPEKILFMSAKEAEMTKYASNAMLAAKISFMNEIAAICDRLEVDVENVRIGIGSDARIGNAFLYPGCGYGGSCFPKDVKALIHLSRHHGVEPNLLCAVEERNHRQKHWLPNKVVDLFGEDLQDISIGVWGLSFKPGTDDLREASSLVLIDELLKRNATLNVYDPVAMPAAKQLFPSAWLASGRLSFAGEQYEATKNADALVLVTEWKPFCSPDLALMKSQMRRPIILDGRNQYDPGLVRGAGFLYFGVGRGAPGHEASLFLNKKVADLS